MLVPSGGKRSRSLNIGCPGIPSAESVVSEGTWCCKTASAASFPSVDAWITGCSLFVLVLISSHSGISSSCRPSEYLSFSCLRDKQILFSHDPLMIGNLVVKLIISWEKLVSLWNYFWQPFWVIFHSLCNDLNIVNFSWYQGGTWFTQNFKT